MGCRTTPPAAPPRNKISLSVKVVFARHQARALARRDAHLLVSTIAAARTGVTTFVVGSTHLLAGAILVFLAGELIRQLAHARTFRAAFHAALRAAAVSVYRTSSVTALEYTNQRVFTIGVDATAMGEGRTRALVAVTAAGECQRTASKGECELHQPRGRPPNSMEAHERGISQFLKGHNARCGQGQRQSLHAHIACPTALSDFGRADGGEPLNPGGGGASRRPETAMARTRNLRSSLPSLQRSVRA